MPTTTASMEETGHAGGEAWIRAPQAPSSDALPELGQTQAARPRTGVPSPSFKTHWLERGSLTTDITASPNNNTEMGNIRRNTNCDPYKDWKCLPICLL